MNSCFFIIVLFLVISILLANIRKNPETPKESQEICLFMLICLCFTSLSQPIGIISFRGFDNMLYRFFKSVRMHAHVPKSSNAEDVTFHIVNNFVIVVDDGSTITYLPVG